MKQILLVAFSVFCIGIIVSGSKSYINQGSASKANQLTTLTGDQDKKDTTAKTVYTCPMHPEVTQAKAGKCPKCGMNLTAKQMVLKTYACPMHPEVAQDKAGKCPKCGMNLVLKEAPKKAGKL